MSAARRCDRGARALLDELEHAHASDDLCAVRSLLRLAEATATDIAAAIDTDGNTVQR